MKKVLRIINAILATIAFLLGIIAIYWLILKITGHSPETDQVLLINQGIIVTVMIFIAGILIELFGEIRELKGEFKQFSKRLEKVE